VLWDTTSCRKTVPSPHSLTLSLGALSFSQLAAAARVASPAAGVALSEASTPLHHSSTPLHHSSTPLHHSSTPDDGEGTRRRWTPDEDAVLLARAARDGWNMDAQVGVEERREPPLPMAGCEKTPLSQLRRHQCRNQITVAVPV
jgi:hypothetical protein